MKWRLRKWWYKVMRRLCHSIIEEELTDALHPDFGWMWRQDGEGTKYLDVAHRQGCDEMLESIRASLRDYPNGGGDIEVMREVDRLVAAARQG